MLRLTDITKTYEEKSDSSVRALKGISLNFRPCEFVSVLGPSGCGKTTLLNIIGGLDRYTDGDLVINGRSTKEYGDRDWDTYRNHSIGFVFQSYNLIPHQTILENVELTMTLGGVPKEERRKRAREALVAVGLGDKLNKRPSKLSGGQMQRVSIARALVGDPDIILADEPTGALDSETGVMVMELLKEISKTKLVIMVTHNPELAYKYSDRIIKMLDGNVVEDSAPCSDEEEAAFLNNDDSARSGVTYKKKHSSMSLLTALRLSGKNLLSKKRRTLITSLASSIGLIGMAIILSVSNGMQAYIDQTMLDSTSFNYITVSSSVTKMPDIASQGGTRTDMTEYPENTTGIYPYKQQMGESIKQDLSEDYLSYLKDKTDGLVVDIAYTYNVSLNVLTKKGDKCVLVDTSTWSEALSNHEYVSGYYTVLAGEGTSAVPSKATEVAIVVDKYNRLSTSVLDALGIAYTENEDGGYGEIKYEELLGKEFRVVYNDGWYTPTVSGGTTIYRGANATNYEAAYENENGITVKVVSVLRENEDASASWLSSGIAYSPELTQAVLAANKGSAVVSAQLASRDIDVTTGDALSDEGGGAGGFVGGMLGGGAASTYDEMLVSLGYTQTPASITIYPNDTASREKIIEYLDSWNTVNENTDKVVRYTDMSSIMTSMLGTVVDIVTYVLMAFSITSLVISSIMIAIIIYASVIERIKEIGVLRSIGARKKDISRVFEAEAVILGFASGVIAIGFTLIANVVINAILNNLTGVSTIADLAPLTAVGLVALSMALLLVASLVPAGIAAKKEPAVALRTE